KNPPSIYYCRYAHIVISRIFYLLYSILNSNLCDWPHTPMKKGLTLFSMSPLIPVDERASRIQINRSNPMQLSAMNTFLLQAAARSCPSLARWMGDRANG